LLCFVSRIDLLISVVCLPPQNMSVVLLTRQYYHFFKACMCPPAQCPCYMNYLNVCLSAISRKGKERKEEEKRHHGRREQDREQTVGN
jgi:hypothetical protein